MNRNACIPALALATVCLFSSCKDTTTPGGQVTVATSAVLLSGGGQSAGVGQALPNPIVVHVTDAAGNAVVGQLVRFQAASGSTQAGATATDANGNATEHWTLGTTAG